MKEVEEANGARIENYIFVVISKLVLQAFDSKAARRFDFDTFFLSAQSGWLGLEGLELSREKSMETQRNAEIATKSPLLRRCAMTNSGNVAHLV